jgi:flavin reductase (DIM6/NTAB) family NADH-FMN oxidoreductase RutF/rubredoxin
MDYNAFFKITYGLYILCSGDKDSGNGFISNTIFQVTSEPPKLAACCNKDNYTSEVIEKAGCFTVSILQQETDPVIFGTFGYKSGRNTNKMEGMDIKYGQTGAPIVLNESIAYFECKVTDKIDVGTHWMFIAEIIDAQLIDDSKEPITYDYYRNVKKGVAPKNAPTYIDKSKLEKSNKMKKSFKCNVCGYVYDENKEELAFEKLSDSWLCPVCGAEKSEFEEIKQ